MQHTCCYMLHYRSLLPSSISEPDQCCSRIKAPSLKVPAKLASIDCLFRGPRLLPNSSSSVRTPLQHRATSTSRSPQRNFLVAVQNVRTNPDATHTFCELSRQIPRPPSRPEYVLERLLARFDATGHFLVEKAKWGVRQISVKIASLGHVAHD